MFILINKFRNHSTPPKKIINPTASKKFVLSYTHSGLPASICPLMV